MAIPDNFAQKDLIGELVTLMTSHQLTRNGLPEWEIKVLWGNVPLQIRAFDELRYALELAGVELCETPNGSNWQSFPVYFATLGYDEKHNRLTLSAVKTPSGKFTLDLEAWDKRREKAAPEMPVLARKETPKAETVTQIAVSTAHLSIEDKAKLAEQLLLELASELKPEQEYKRYFALQAVSEIRKLGYNEPPKWVKPAKRK